MNVFIWKISNLHSPGVVESPEFFVHSLKESGWQLRLNIPTKWTEKVTLHLANNHFTADRDDECCNVGCEVSILSKVPDQSFSCLKESISFRPSTQVALDGYPSWFTMARVRKDDYLPKGVLTVQCKLWLGDMDAYWMNPIMPPEFMSPVYYHAVTRLGVRKYSVDWVLNTYELAAENIQTKEFRLGGPVFKVETDIQRNNTLGFNIKQCNTKFHRMVVTCNISLLDVNEQVTLAKEYTLNLKCGVFSRFTGFFDVRTFEWCKEEYVKYDSVKMMFDFTYDTGEEYSVVEGVSKFPPEIDPNEPPSGVLNQSTSKISMVDASTGTESYLPIKVLQENLLDMYVTNSLSDVALHAEACTFPCHKLILSARSPVLKTLLSEHSSHNTELKASTVGSMLRFLYTGDIGVSMDFQNALELYEAASKYQIISLKDVCLEYLETNMTEENVCDVLILASKCEDMELKNRTDNFILSSPNKNDILYSSKWMDVIKKYPISTLDLLRVLVEEKMDNEIFSIMPSEIPRYEIRKSTEKHRSDFLSIFQSPVFSDFTLRTNSKTFAVHKNILWARSPVFKAMISNSKNESSIDIPDVDDKTMEQLLCFMYSGTTIVPELEDLIKLCYLAEKYQISFLRDWCHKSFVQALSIKNVCEGLVLVEKYKDLEFKNDVLNFFVKNDESIILSSEWKNFIEKNSKLGLEVVSEIYRRKTDGNTTIYDLKSLTDPEESKLNEFIFSEGDVAVILQVDFTSLFEEKFLSDCTLIVKNKSIAVHKNILCARSPVFNAMFTSNLKEATTNTLDIPDIDEKTVDLMLRYLYSGTFSDPENLMINLESLYYAADKYQVETLRDWCSTLLAERINMCFGFTNICKLLVFADRHGDKRIEKVARENILNNLEEVLNSDLWQHIMLTEPGIAAKTMQYILSERPVNWYEAVF